jgi:exonuclease SbcD
MIRILHLADLHLGRSHRYLGDKADARRKEADGLLGRVADWVLANRPDINAVVIAGDLFETYRPDDALVGETLRALRKMADAGKTVVTLPGNHDELSYSNSVYRTHGRSWPGVLVTSPVWARAVTVQTADGPCHLYGLAYQAGLTPASLDVSIPLEPEGLHVAVLHASVGLPGRDRAIQATWEDLGRLGVDYVALGHVHKPARRRLSRGTAVYPGLIEGGGFDDPGCGELTVVTLGDGRAEVEKVPFPGRPIRTEKIDLAELGDASLSDRIRTMADPDLVLRVVLTGTTGSDVQAALVAGERADLFHHLEVREDFTILGSGELEAAAREETVLGAVLRDLRERAGNAGAERERAVAERALLHAWSAFRGGPGHE